MTFAATLCIALGLGDTSGRTVFWTAGVQSCKNFKSIQIIYLESQQWILRYSYWFLWFPFIYWKQPVQSPPCVLKFWDQFQLLVGILTKAVCGQAQEIPCNRWERLASSMGNSLQWSRHMLPGPIQVGFLTGMTAWLLKVVKHVPYIDGVSSTQYLCHFYVQQIVKKCFLEWSEWY